MKKIKINKRQAIILENLNENNDIVYVDFLNKDKNFKPDRKWFKSYDLALEWVKQNFDKFDVDIIKYANSSNQPLCPNCEGDNYDFETGWCSDCNWDFSTNEGLKKSKKILKITERQLKNILENSIVNQDMLKIMPDKAQFKHDVNSGAKGLYHENYFKEFVNELYTMNESGVKKYVELYPLMEVAGFIKNGKLKKETFKNNKNIAEMVINEGLKLYNEGGSKFIVMERMVNKLNELTDDEINKSLKNQITQKSGKKFTDDDIKRALEKVRKDSLNIEKSRFKNSDDYLTDDSDSGIINLNEDGLDKFECLYLSSDNSTAILKKADVLYVLDLNEFDKSDFEEYSNANTWQEKDEDGIVVNFFGDFDLDEETITNFANNSRELKMGDDYFGYDGNLFVINDEIKEYLLSGTNNDQKLNQILGNIGETTTTSSVGGMYVAPLGSSKANSNINDEMVEIIDEQGIGNVGAYDTPGFAASDFFGNKNKKGKARVNKGVTHKKPMIKGGQFVTENEDGFIVFDDCTKLNNNKEAQNGGCSVGAVDNVVKYKK